MNEKAHGNKIHREKPKILDIPEIDDDINRK
jgi:hypothetical protein